MRSKNNDTAKQVEDFVNRYYEANLRTPTLREIETGTGVSRQTVQRCLKSMDQTGAAEIRRPRRHHHRLH